MSLRFADKPPVAQLVTRISTAQVIKTSFVKARHWNFTSIGEKFMEFLKFHSAFRAHNGKYVKNSARVFCFPKQTIRSNCRHKALGIALVVCAAVALALSKIYQKPRLYIHSCDDDGVIKNSLNPLCVCSVVVGRWMGMRGDVRRRLGSDFPATGKFLHGA